MLSYMQKLCLFCLIIAFSTASLNAQSWVVENLYGSTSADEQAFELVSHANGNVTHIAYTYSLGNPGTYPNIHVVHSDPLGNPIWEQTYEMPVATPASAGIAFTGMAIIETVSGEFVWTAGVHTTDPLKSDIMVCRTNSVGNVIWTTTFGQGNTKNDVSTDIIEDPNTGTLYLTGYSDDALGQGQDDIFVGALTGAGTTMWQRLYGRPDIERAHGIGLLSNGNLAMVGETNSSTVPFFEGFMFAIDPSTLIVQWGRHYGTNTLDERLYSFLEHPNGNLYACGTRFQGGNESVYVVEAQLSNGNELNSAYYDVTSGNRERAWHITRIPKAEEMIMVGEAPGIIGGSTDGFQMEIKTNLAVTNYRLYGTPYNDVLRCIEYTPGNMTNGPTAAGCWMVGYTDGNSTDDEHLLRSNLVGKTGCDEIENVSATLISNIIGTYILFATVLPSPIQFGVNDIPVGSYMPWCSGQYVGTYAAKTGADVNSSVNTALALNIELSPQPLTIGAEATLDFTLDSDAELEVVLHDMRGRQVFTLPYSAVAGANSVGFKPAGLSSGAYVLSLNGLAETKSLNVILLD